MKLVCPLCEQIVASENLFCEKSDCPSENALMIWATGDWIGEFEIVRLISVLPAAAIYECKRQDEPVLLKVAHQGDAHKERLKREAIFLQRVRNHKRLPTSMPILLPPSSEGDDQASPYGKIVNHQQLLYYCVFETFEGDSLRAITKKRPQLWTQYVGWAVLQIAEVLSFLHTFGLFHLGLCPEAVMIRFDNKPPGAPRTLLIDLGLLGQTDNIAQVWYPGFIHPAYAAPEQIDGASLTLRKLGQTVRLDPGTDVYGLGIIFYELLVGEPPISYKLRSHAQIFRDILSGKLVELSRKDDVAKIAKLARHATNVSLAERIRQVNEFGGALIKYFGETPPPPKESPVSTRTLLVVGSGLLIVAALLVTAMVLG